MIQAYSVDVYSCVVHVYSMHGMCTVHVWYRCIPELIHMKLRMLVFSMLMISGGFKGGKGGANEPPFGLDLVQRSTGDRLNGTPLSV